MSKEYQRKNDLTIPQNQWVATIYTIRDYYRYKEAIDNSIGLSAVTSDGHPHGSGTGDPTAKQGMKLASSYESRMVHIIDSCFTLIPPEYRRGVWDNVMWRKPYPSNGHRNTYGHWKQVFIVSVSRKICAPGEK